jgi:hypothetical protein
MADRVVDVLIGVLQGDSKAVEGMALDVDIDVLVLVAAGNGWISAGVIVSDESMR